MNTKMIDLDNVNLDQVRAHIETDKGTMTVRFYPDDAPGHVRNFCDLAQRGFYDGLAFHRVVSNFMIQGGCPNTREGSKGMPGTGGPGHQIKAEFNDRPHKRGVLSMARSSNPDSAGSQFFIVHGAHAASLDGKYTAFGEIVEGFDVLDAIATTEVDFGAGGERSRPVERQGIARVALELVADAPEDGGAAGSGEGEAP